MLTAASESFPSDVLPEPLPRGVHRGHDERGVPVLFAITAHGELLCIGHFAPNLVDEPVAVARIAGLLDAYDPPTRATGPSGAVLPFAVPAPRRFA